MSDCVSEAFRLAAGKTGDSVEWFEAPSILRYEPGGFFLAHADSCLLDPANNNWFKVKDRDLSLLIYLNEDFTGGGLSFVNFNFHLRPRTGDMLVFPSDNRYAHQAEIVKSGFRYVIVSWAALRGSQKVCDRPPVGVIRPEKNKGSFGT
jgi:predicted 2-oxoglutarate/Fe(II)-dependent dioxygenase YbiX